MQETATARSRYGLERHGITNTGTVYWNLSTPSLYEEAVRRREGLMAHLGPLVVRTGQYTGRSPNDKFIVREPTSQDKVWWGDVNRPMEEAHYLSLRHRLLAFLQGRDLFVQDCFVGADPQYRMPIRVVTQAAWHSLFARNIFIQAPPEGLADHEPQFTVIQAPGFFAIPEVDHTNSEAFVVVNLGAREVIIGGTAYAGEAKKAVFSVESYLLPPEGVLPMHCSANMGPEGNVALFFGLSGTGKTTLSVTAQRTLIGDDEHGWSDRGIFNLEGGCYAKVVRLSASAEPEIYETTRRFGTVLENVAIDPVRRRIDLDDDRLTENTRAAFPIPHLPLATRGGTGGHPTAILMLTADAFGVLPPISRLTPEQAMYHFLSGYTSRLAGTERGVQDPEATFSACFGAPFMALHPIVYGRLLAERISRHGSTVWLVNTGWSGGPYGVGRRMEIAYTRAMARAAVDGELDGIPTRRDPVFGVEVPTACPGVPPGVLEPRGTWADPAAYDDTARRLARAFAANFQQFGGQVPASVVAAGPSAL